MANEVNSNSTAVETAENPAAATKKSPRSKSKREKAHPPTSEMVNTAIKELKERNGSSLQAIKKYITATYKVNGEKFSFFIKKYLKSAVKSGVVVQTKGKGASGSFKLNSEKNSEVSKSNKVLRPVNKSAPKRAQSVEKKIVTKKTAAVKKPSAPKKVAAAEKKPAAAKKSVVKVAVAKSKTATEAKSMSKSKKNVKTPAAKTRTPKPRKTAAPKTVKSATKN